MRGQLFSFDFLLAVSLILFIFALSLYVSENTAITLNQKEAQRDLKAGAANALSHLLGTPGNPSNWGEIDFTDANVKSIGVASSRNVLDPRKTSHLFSLANSNYANYSLIKRILAIDLPSSNYSISISDLGGSPIYETNIAPPMGVSVYSYSRIATLEGVPVTVNLMVWVEK